jgi:uncharacterized protein (TIGR03437 family)
MMYRAGTMLSALFALPLLLDAQTISTAAGSTAWRGAADVAVDAQGNLYVADYDGHRVYKVDRQANSTVFAGTGAAGATGDGAQAVDARLNGPLAVAVDAAGNVYIAEYLGDRIRKVAPNGVITTFAGTGQGGFTGDGGPANAARINNPVDLAIDPAGNLFFADYANYRIRRVGTNGTISTFAGTGRRASAGDGGPAAAADMAPAAINFGPDGSLYVADSGIRIAVLTPKIRRIAPNGVVSTVAGSGAIGFLGDGGPATQARFQSVDGVAADAAGNVYVAEFNGHRIRKINPEGVITTYAGTSTPGFSGDGGEPAKAQINSPIGLTVDSQGTLLIADYRNQRVRKIVTAAVPAIRGADSAVPVFGGQSGLSTNMYMDIRGVNLSQTTRLWSPEDFSGGVAPRSLDGVSVLINQKQAFVQFVSPNHIRAIAPEDAAEGPVPVQVRTPIGVSNVGTAVRARVSPTLHATGDIEGKRYVLATTPDYRFYVGSPSVVAGVAGVKPGDTILIHALGCGATDPAVAPGVAAPEDAAMALGYELRIGGVPAAVSSAVMVGGSIGLYRFTLTAPDLPAGEHSVELSVDGVANGQGLAIIVSR